jgi:hypothetical protein
MTPTHSVRCSAPGCLPAQTNQSKARPRQPQAGVLGRLADWKDARGTLLVHTQDRRDGDVRRSKVS